MLWNEAFSINDFVVDLIAQFIPECFEYDFECVAFVMAFQILHVLEHESYWPFNCDYPRDIKEESPLCFAGKAMGDAKRVLF